MAVASLTTSLEDFEGSPTTVNYGGGQGAGSNDDIILEGAQSYGRRVDNATDKGFGVTITSTDVDGTHIKIWLAVTQWAEVTAVKVRIDDGTITYDQSLPAAEIPSRPASIPIWFDPTGLADETAIIEIGALITIGDVGGSAQNMILDEITHGSSGLRWTGTGGDIADFVAFEASNSEGVIVETPAGLALYFRVESGDNSTATSFTFDQKLIAPDQGLVTSDAVGFDVDLRLAGDTFTGANGGGIEAADIAGQTNRPDMIFTGTGGTATLEAGFQLIGMRLIELTSAVTITGGTYDGLALTQANADISGCVIRPRSASAVAMITDPDFTNLADIEFVQVGSGHALEIDTVGTYTLDNLRGLNTDGGFGADATNDAGIYVSASSGTVTLNIINGGDTPTVRTAGATVVINNTKTVTVTAIDADTQSAVSGARVFLEAASGGNLPSDDSVTITSAAGTATVTHTAHGLSTGDRVAIRGAIEEPYNGLKTITVVNANSYTYTVSGSPASPATGTIEATAVIMTGLTNVSGVFSITDFAYTADQDVRGWVRKGSAAPYYTQAPLAGTITTNGFTTTAPMVEEPA